MAEQRLPAVNGDDGVWGTILNQYLTKEHYNTGIDNAGNGGHKNITIRPGSSGVGGAPLKFSSGSLLSSPEPGAMEFFNDKYYLTQTTGSIRKTIAVYDDTNGTTGDMYYRDAAGVLTRVPIGLNGQSLVVVSGLPQWTATGTVANKTSLDFMISDVYSTAYLEVSNNLEGNPTQVNVWSDASKATPLFTKDINYDGNGEIYEVVITDNISNSTLTIGISYVGNDVRVTKVYS
jgi:hypothetical protein